MVLHLQGGISGVQLIMTSLKLEEILKDEPKYRITQVHKLIFSDFIEDWQEATILPKNLRNRLDKELPLEIKTKFFFSKDQKTIKALIYLEDKLATEAVLMIHTKKRNSICVSSQVGCPLGCKFCATGKMGFKRNLSTSEIIDQVLLFGRLLKKKGGKITNIVFMGMGEPFLNYDNVLSAIKILNDKDKFNLGARRISISTAGLPQAIRRFADENIEINLAVSLHAPNDKLRTSLMPINQPFPIKKVLESVNEYIKKTGRKVMFEYILLKGVNDHITDAEELSRLLNHPLYHLNLIPYNPTGDFKSSNTREINTFKRVLRARNIPFTQRFRFGVDIGAACGQLAGTSTPL